MLHADYAGRDEPEDFSTVARILAARESGKPTLPPPVKKVCPVQMHWTALGQVLTNLAAEDGAPIELLRIRDAGKGNFLEILVEFADSEDRWAMEFHLSAVSGQLLGRLNAKAKETITEPVWLKEKMGLR